MPYFLETLNSDNHVSLRKKLFVGCDTSDFGCNGGLVDNAFSFDHENLDLHGELLHTHKDLLVTHVEKFSYSVEISQNGWRHLYTVSKEYKLA